MRRIAIVVTTIMTALFLLFLLVALDSNNKNLKANSYVSLAEEIGAARKGDTLTIITTGDTISLEYYSKGSTGKPLIVTGN